MTAFDLVTAVEQAARRAMGWKRTVTQKTYVGPRPDATSPLDRPELLWPSRRASIPRSCWHCGAGSTMFDTDPPYGLVKTGQVTCLACSRVVVRLKADGTRPVPGRSAS